MIIRMHEEGLSVPQIAKVSKKTEEEVAQIKDNIKVVKGLEKTFYSATEFSIEDNNGYLPTFAEDEK